MRFPRLMAAVLLVLLPLIGCGSSDNAYWACMAEWGFERDEPVTDRLDLDRLEQADAACESLSDGEGRSAASPRG